MNLFGIKSLQNNHKSRALLDGITTRLTHIITVGEDRGTPKTHKSQSCRKHCFALTSPILNEGLAGALKGYTLREN